MNIVRKITLSLGLSVFCFFLVACSQVDSLSDNLTLSDADINKYLEKYLGQEQSIGLSGVAKASLAFKNFNVNIGREEAGKVALSGGINFSISSILGGPSAGFDIKVKARPVYNAQEGAIYLKELELNDFAVNSNFGSKNASALTPYLNSALQFYFDQRPVYALSGTAGAFKEAITDIRVERGRIVFQLGM